MQLDLGVSYGWRIGSASLMQITDALMRKVHRITAPPVRGALMLHRCSDASMFLFLTRMVRLSRHML